MFIRLLNRAMIVFHPFIRVPIFLTKELFFVLTLKASIALLIQNDRIQHVSDFKIHMQPSLNENAVAS